MTSLAGSKFILAYVPDERQFQKKSGLRGIEAIIEFQGPAVRQNDLSRYIEPQPGAGCQRLGHLIGVVKPLQM